MTYTPGTYASYSTGSAKAGSMRHHEGPHPGECAVDYDSSLTFYKIPRGMRKGFRAWVADVWQKNGETPRVTGSWPYYSVEF